MPKDLVINSLICSWLDLQRPCSELSASTPSSDPRSVPHAELRSAGHGCGITSERSHPGSFSSLTPGEPAGTARSAEAVTALPLWIWGEEAGSASRCPGMARRAGRERRLRGGQPAGLAGPAGMLIPRAPHAPAGPEVAARSGIPQAPAELSQLFSCSQILPPKNQVDMQIPLLGCYSVSNNTPVLHSSSSR